MLLYNSIGPNPRVVRIFMAERGIALPKVEVDIRSGENRQAPFVAKNPTATCPALELDDGTIISEIVAICEYLDEVTPGVSLVGSTPQERATTRMWSRRIDLNILEPMTNGFRYSDGLRMFQSRLHCIPSAAEDLKQTAQEWLTWLDGQMAGKQFICGDRLTLADILLFGFVDFFDGVRQPINAANQNIVAWHARMKARPSATA